MESPKGVKQMHRSKTVWFNVLYTLAGILALAQGWEFLPEDAPMYIIAAQGVVNLLLRRITNQPVTLS